MNTKIIMNFKYFVLIFGFACFLNCSERKVYGEENPEFYIQRFDVDFYRYLTHNELDATLNIYKQFLPVFGDDILGIGLPEEPHFFSKLKEYFSHPAIMDLYKVQQSEFQDISLINKELSEGLDAFLQEFPSISKPRVYMHVSGWEQKVVVTDDVLSLSADFYLGADYPRYQDYFYDYQLKNMNADRIVPDYLLGFMMANLPFSGNQEVLLDRILYEGKLVYILSRLLPDRQIWEYIGYTKEEYLWCSNNQERIWGLILENQHLFTPNALITSQYLKDAPHTAFLPNESPGKVGVWVGYQIIIAFMKHHPDVTLKELVDLTDYQKILKESRYKP